MHEDFAEKAPVMPDLSRREMIALSAAATIAPIIPTPVAAGVAADEGSFVATELPVEGQMYVVKHNEEWFLLDHWGALYGPYEKAMDAIMA